jgi:hypothetical protein
MKEWNKRKSERKVERRLLVWLENAGWIGGIKGGVEIGVEEEVKIGKVGWKERAVRTEKRS